MKISSLMAAASLSFAGSSFCLAAAIGFEADSGYSVDADASKLPGWTASASGVAKATDEVFNDGNQSLEIFKSEKDQAVAKSVTIPKDGILYIDFMIRPTADPEENPVYSVAANGAVLGFLKEGDTGTVVAVVGDQKPSTATNFSFEVDDDNLAVDWVRVTIREDVKAKTWDLFLNGKLTLVDQSLIATDAGAFQVYSSSQGRFYIDDLLVTEFNPLFPDSDKDGLPDAYEEATGTNPLLNDRASFMPGSELSNIKSFLSENNFRLTNAFLKMRVIYVDNNNGKGSDADKGEYSYRVENRGPKSTLEAAINNSDENTIIALMESARPYKLTAKKDADEQPVKLMPVGRVIIEGEN